MKSLFIVTDKEEIISRINKLTPETQKQWGKMNVCQMLAHTSFAIEAALGERFVKRSLIGKIFGGFAKPMTTNDRPFGHNAPTHPDYIIANPEEFEIEKKKIIGLIQKMYDGGKAAINDNIHPFFGKLTSTQWGSLMYKHTDHHLRQFGV